MNCKHQNIRLFVRHMLAGWYEIGLVIGLDIVIEEKLVADVLLKLWLRWPKEE